MSGIRAATVFKLATLVVPLMGALTFNAVGIEDELAAEASPDGAIVELSPDQAEASTPEQPELAPAASLDSPAPARFFTINQVLAKQHRVSSSPPLTRLAAVHSSGSIVDAPTGLSAVRQPDEPFGLFTFRAPEGLLWQKWREVSAAVRVDLREVADCREQEGSCSRAAKNFGSLIDSAKRASGRQRYDLVNRAINGAVHYVSDITNHGVADKWSAPLATLSSGRGDCEDYAIAKYVVLLEAGVAKRDLRLVLVHDRVSRQHHAVLAVRHDGHWLIMDNRWSELRPDRDVAFTPLFTVSAEGVRLFVAPYSMRGLSADQITPAAY